MPVQFNYPQEGWSTGRVRKVKMDRRIQDYSSLAEMERAAGFGLAARGGPGAGVDITPVMKPKSIGTEGMVDAIAQHKQQIQDGVNQVAQGSMDITGLSKLLKKLGWSRLEKTGEFVDPSGTAHVIGPQGAEEQK